MISVTEITKNGKKMQRIGFVSAAEWEAVKEAVNQCVGINHYHVSIDGPNLRHFGLPEVDLYTDLPAQYMYGLIRGVSHFTHRSPATDDTTNTKQKEKKRNEHEVKGANTHGAGASAGQGGARVGGLHGAGGERGPRL